MFINQFQNYLHNERRLSVHTVRAYVDDVIAFNDYIALEFKISDLKTVNYIIVRSWVAKLMEQKLSAKSVNRKISSLKSFYKLLKRDGEIAENPTAKIVKPKTSKRLPVFVEQKNINQLFDSIEFEKTYEGVRDRLILNMFYSTGMRLSELINLTPKSIDINLKQIKVLGKRNKERIIPITNELLIELKTYLILRNELELKSDKLFITNKGAKLYEKFVYRLVNAYLSQVSTVTKRSPHVLRHTFATHMLNNGAELNAIKELLGHANLSATEVYTHNTFDKLKNIYKQAHPRA